MKSSLVALLVAVVCVEQDLTHVHSNLWCFVCEDEPSKWNCGFITRCADTDKYCITATRTSGSGQNMVHRVSQGCSPNCPDSRVNGELGTLSTECCNSSLCNMSGATSVKTSTALTALGILASFFCVFRTGL